MRSITTFFSGIRKRVKPPRSRSTFPSFRLGVEALEDRELISASPVLVAQPAVVQRALSTTPTELSALAQSLQASGKLAKPTGPTLLYINFDGWSHTPYSDTVGTNNL